MAKKRYINTKFWSDNYISDLDPIEKLLFMYFLTNPFTDICGIYEISMKQVALDTGIDKQEMIPKIVNRFSRDGKIFYIDGWVYVKNFAKHQAINDKIKIGIKRSIKDVPVKIMSKISQLDIDYDSLSIDCQLLKPKPILKPILKLKLKPNLSLAIPSVSQDIAIIIDLFKSVNPSYRKFFGNNTQRSAAERLSKNKDLPFDVLQRLVVEVLPKFNADKYVPGRAKSITPLQFEDNLGYIKAWMDQQSMSVKKREIISDN